MRFASASMPVSEMSNGRVPLSRDNTRRVVREHDGCYWKHNIKASEPMTTMKGQRVANPAHRSYSGVAPAGSRCVTDDLGSALLFRVVRGRASGNLFRALGFQGSDHTDQSNPPHARLLFRLR